MIKNSTIIPKKKLLKCGCFDYNFSKGLCKAHSTIVSTQKRIAKFETEEEGEDFTNLVDDLDMWFSRYVRLRYADNEGFVHCFTSGKKMRWQRAQCGHYISRKHFATRWLPDNCRPQSEYDNCNLSGNLEVFKKKLEEEKSGITEWLLEQSREVVKPTRDELKEMIIDFRTKSKLLEKKIQKPKL
jgi:hypothetical protein